MIRTRIFQTVLLLSLFVLNPSNGSGQQVFNGGPITISSGSAALYSSQINISNFTGTITEIRVSITGLSHAFPEDLGALFVGPTGAHTILFYGPGPQSGTAISNVNLTFRDGAPAPLSNEGAITSGEYKPGQQQYPDDFSPPAPQGVGNSPPTYPTTFSAFVGTPPNGTYTLYVEDFVDGDGGSIGSWSIAVFGITPVPEPSSVLLCVSGFGIAGAAIRRRWKGNRNG